MAQALEAYEVEVTVRVRVTTGDQVPLERVQEMAREVVLSGRGSMPFPGFVASVVHCERPEALVWG